MRTLASLSIVVAALGLVACAEQKREFGKADVDAINNLVQGFGAGYNARRPTRSPRCSPAVLC